MPRLSRVKREDFSHIVPPEGSKIVPLTQGKYALVDEEDYERVMQYNWTLEDKSIGVMYAKNIKFYLHRFIMGVTDPKIKVDHIFHDGLDNRKANLRVCTHKQNMGNMRGQKNKTSAFKGVCYSPSKKKWRATFSVQSKSKHIGYYTTEEDAAKAYDNVVRELRGEFAYLNFR